MSDITILIQGPLNGTSIENMPNYLKYGNVVCSHWQQDVVQAAMIVKKGMDWVRTWCPSEFEAETVMKAAADIYQRSLEQNVYGSESSKIKIVVQPMVTVEEWEDTWAGDRRVQSTFPWAWNSTWWGLKNIDTKYVIKTRSDERFSNLQPLIDMFMEDPKKLVFGSVFARNWFKERFMMGDHIFMAETETLLKTYDTILESEEFRYPAYCGENIVCINYLRTVFGNKTNVFEHPTFDKDIEAQTALAKKALGCIDINLLGDFVVWHRHAGIKWENTIDMRNVATSNTPNGVSTFEEMFTR